MRAGPFAKQVQSHMADQTTAAKAAPTPSSKDIARAEAFTRETFVHDGETAESALAEGSPRRIALDAALGEIAQGRDVPTTHWRRDWSLLLGLERLLSEDEPQLADGTTLNPHQVDALSGTLTALLAERLRGAENGAVAGAAPVLAVDDDDEDADEDEEVAAELAAFDEAHAQDDEEDEDDDEEDEDDDEEDEDDDEEDEDDDEEDEDDDEEDEDDEEPEGASDDQPDDDENGWNGADETDEDVDAAVLDDPNAHKRFWFEHATGAGKTVAAMGFVEASRTGGVLILTHRRNLVDQFNEELRTRGYADRVSEAAAGRRQGPRRRPRDGRDLPVVRAQRGRDLLARTRSSSATRRTQRWARRRAPRSACGRARSSSA